MKPLVFWLLLCALLLLAALTLRQLPGNWQGALFTGLMFLGTGALLANICRGSK